MRLVIGYLYPDIMSAYGDVGNVRCVERRCAWRGIQTEVRELRLRDRFEPAEIDLFFIGGGADSHQELVADDLREVKGPAIRAAVEDGAAVFAVCAGYQLFGQWYRPIRGNDLQGLGLFDVTTVHRGAQLGVMPTTIAQARTLRSVGDLVVRWGDRLLVGFENHGGRTYPGEHAQPLGEVLVGRGNNGEDGLEGTVYRNAVGTYLHGPGLPRNPALADHLVAAGLTRRHGPVELAPLEDGLELAAQAAALGRMDEARGRRRGRLHRVRG